MQADEQHSAAGGYPQGVSFGEKRPQHEGPSGSCDEGAGVRVRQSPQRAVFQGRTFKGCMKKASDVRCCVRCWLGVCYLFDQHLTHLIITIKTR